jgi:hypothetical protein
MAAAAAAAATSKTISKSVRKNAIPFIPLMCARDYIAAKLIDASRIPDEPHVISLDIWHIIVGSFMHSVDYNDPEKIHPRNHECPQLVQNLMQNPSLQLSPAIIDALIHKGCKNINIHQHLVLIDIMYSQEDKTSIIGLTTTYPTFLTEEILTVQGIIQIYDNDHDHDCINYTSVLEPVIIPCDVTEMQVKEFIEDIDSFRARRQVNHFKLINIMDCTSHTMRHTWANNNRLNVYQAMPDCFANDANIAYLPIISGSNKSEDGDTLKVHWCNWDIEKDNLPIYRDISPNTYTFITNLYRRRFAEIYLVGWFKISSRIRVKLDYKLSNGTVFQFNTLTLDDFVALWTMPEFQLMVMNYMDSLFEYNVLRFIELLLDTKNLYELSYLADCNLQKALDAFIMPKIQELQEYFPEDPRLDISNLGNVSDYLRHQGIHL